MNIVRFPSDHLIERSRNVAYRTLFELFASERKTTLVKKYILDDGYNNRQDVQFQHWWKLTLADESRWIVYTFTDPDTNIHYHQWVPLGEDE